MQDRKNQDGILILLKAKLRTNSTALLRSQGLLRLPTDTVQPL